MVAVITGAVAPVVMIAAHSATSPCLWSSRACLNCLFLPASSILLTLHGPSTLLSVTSLGWLHALCLQWLSWWHLKYHSTLELQQSAMATLRKSPPFSGFLEVLSTGTPPLLEIPKVGYNLGSLYHAIMVILQIPDIRAIEPGESDREGMRLYLLWNGFSKICDHIYMPWCTLHFMIFIILGIIHEVPLCDESHFYLYFSSFFPYISVPILMFSLSSHDLSLTLSLPLSWIVTSLLLCHHL